MKKQFKSRFTKAKSTESASKSKLNIEFYSLIKAYLSRPGIKLYLNIPETIVMNCPGSDPFLLYTDVDDLLYIKEKITSE